MKINEKKELRAESSKYLIIIIKNFATTKCEMSR